MYLRSRLDSGTINARALCVKSRSFKSQAGHILHSTANSSPPLQHLHK